jgi:hypothetical protein
MDVRTVSQKVAKDIIKALNVLTYSPAIAAQVLTSAPGPIQHRLYLTIKAVIRVWAIEGRGRTYDPQYKEIYDWAKEIDRGDN